MLHRLAGGLSKKRSTDLAQQKVRRFTQPSFQGRAKSNLIVLGTAFEPSRIVLNTFDSSLTLKLQGMLMRHHP